ncbi:MAG: 3-hydroxybutyrate oligomer hydrolase family protein, partial [Granulosicoccus sp.]
MFVDCLVARQYPIARNFPALSTTLIAGSLLLLVGCSDSSDRDPSNDSGAVLPSLSTLGAVIETRHEGDADGLLGGFGLSGLRTAPEFYLVPENPLPAELRRNSIHANYTGLVDLRPDGGFGSIYGPLDDTLYPGREFRAFIGEGINRATVMLQLPDSFDTSAPCLVVAPSSGSRNAYGAVGTSGEWALSKGCAVAYTDANKGTGAVDLGQNQGFDISLQSVDLATTEAEPTFIVPTADAVDAAGNEYQDVNVPSAAELDDYILNNPYRFAFKHAHSQKNIEKDWGLHTLQSVSFALSKISEATGETLTPANTLIIGASVSNGGAAIIRAAEDSDGLIFDGIVVGEPNLNPDAAPEAFTIAMSGQPELSGHSLPLFDYAVTSELYAACASKAPINAGALFAEGHGDTSVRCNALAEAGLLEPGTIEELGTEANQRLLDAGYLPESTRLLVGYAGIDLFQTLLATYGNAYTRSSVIDNLCAISMAHVPQGSAAPAPIPSLATLAAISSGIPRTANIFLIKNDSPAGPALQLAAESSSGQLDYNLEGALCWQDLRDNPENPLNERLRVGIDEIQVDGNLHGV